MVPGPLLRATEGDTVRIHFINELPEPTVIHFHTGADEEEVCQPN